MEVEEGIIAVARKSKRGKHEKRYGDHYADGGFNRLGEFCLIKESRDGGHDGGASQNAYYDKEDVVFKGHISLHVAESLGKPADNVEDSDE